MMMKKAKIIVHAAIEFMKLNYDLLCFNVHYSINSFNFKAHQAHSNDKICNFNEQMSNTFVSTKKMCLLFCNKNKVIYGEKNLRNLFAIKWIDELQSVTTKLAEKYWSTGNWYGLQTCSTNWKTQRVTQIQISLASASANVRFTTFVSMAMT